MKSLAIIPAFLLLISAAPLLAQSGTARKQAPRQAAKPAAPVPTEVVARGINDRRSSGSFSTLSVTLDLAKFHTGEVEASRVLVRSAVDDTGRSLLKEMEAEPEFESNSLLMHFHGNKAELEARPMSLQLELMNPDRRAKRVTEVSGELELFIPSRDPNSVASFPKFQSLAGKPLAHKALKDNGVEVSIVSREQLAIDKQKFLEKRRKEAIADGAGEDDLEWMMANFEYEFISPGEDDIVLKVKDPNKRINQISFLNGEGSPQPVMQREEEGYVLLSTWGDNPEPDWTMLIKLTTPKSLVRHTFSLTNLQLP